MLIRAILLLLVVLVCVLVYRSYRYRIVPYRWNDLASKSHPMSIRFGSILANRQKIARMIHKSGRVEFRHHLEVLEALLDGAYKTYLVYDQMSEPVRKKAMDLLRKSVRISDLSVGIVGIEIYVDKSESTVAELAEKLEEYQLLAESMQEIQSEVYDVSHRID